MIFHTHCYICGATTRKAIHLRAFYCGFCGSADVTYPLCGYHSRQLEQEMYRMKDALSQRKP